MEPSKAQISEQWVRGTVDQRRARFRHGPAPKSNGAFTYQIEGEQEACSINENQIVTVLQTDPKQGDELTLFHVDAAPDAANGDFEVQSRLHSVTIANIPDTLIRSFSPGPSPWWKLAQNSDALHIIVSAGSGRGHAEACYHNLVEPFFHAMFCRFSIHWTTSPESIITWAKKIFLPAAEAGIEKLIVLISGDGGVVDLINGLIPPGESIASMRERNPDFIPPKLALLPLGTGNALAHSSSVTADRTMGMATLARGNPQRLPVFSTHFNPPARFISSKSSEKENVGGTAGTQDVGTEICHGAVVFSWGLHAALVADSDAPEYRELGSERFQKAAKENLFPADGSQSHAYTGQVSMLTQDVARDKHFLEPIPRSTHSYVLVTLCSQLENGFRISPDSKPLDGQLRIVHFGSKKGEDVMKIMQLAYDGGKHVQDPEVGYKAINGLKLTFEEEEERWRRICVDGKIFVCPRGASVDVLEEEASVLDMIYLDKQ
ncbi:MAG: hypothetical protein M1831_007537 [Alyxoria varia]|nr:MAG: hypothetical protein M1831_007537 [Alyxoria varia]